MAKRDTGAKSIEKIIKRGYVRHDEILPDLKKAGLPQIEPDDVSELVRKYKYRRSGWTSGKVGRGTKQILDKIGSYAAAIIGAGVIAEVIAARKFAESLIGGKLQGFGDNFLYWLGLKKIEITGPEMMSAMAKVAAATLDIVKGLFIGAAIGYVGWKVITRAIGCLLRRSKRRRDIGSLLERNGLAGEGNGK